MTRIIDIVTGVAPRELIFKDRASAEHWLESYRVSQAYKDEHYRIIDSPYQHEELVARGQVQPIAEEI